MIKFNLRYQVLCRLLVDKNDIIHLFDKNRTANSFLLCFQQLKMHFAARMTEELLGFRFRWSYQCACNCKMSNLPIFINTTDKRKEQNIPNPAVWALKGMCLCVEWRCFFKTPMHYHFFFPILNLITYFTLHYCFLFCRIQFHISFSELDSRSPLVTVWLRFDIPYCALFVFLLLYLLFILFISRCSAPFSYVHDVCDRPWGWKIFIISWYRIYRFPKYRNIRAP